jgi:hypothetical protein
VGNTVECLLLPISEVPPRTEVVMVAHSKSRLGVLTEGVEGSLVYASADGGWRFRCGAAAVGQGGD